jgi:hypothetical protein
VRSEEIARGEEVSRSQEEGATQAPLNEEDLNIEEAIRARVAEGAADDGRVIKSCEQVLVDRTVILDICFTIDALYAIYDIHTYSQEHRTTSGSPESWCL